MFSQIINTYITFCVYTKFDVYVFLLFVFCNHQTSLSKWNCTQFSKGRLSRRSGNAYVLRKFSLKLNLFTPFKAGTAIDNLNIADR